MKRKQLYYLLLLIIVCVVFLLIPILIGNQSSNWKFFIKEQVGAKSVLNIGKNLSFDQNSIFFSDGKDTVYSLNKKTGKINWLSKMQDHSPFQITIDNGSIYVSSFDGRIYCLNKNNGYIIWIFSIPEQFWPDTEVVFDENDKLIFFADRAGFLYALDKKTGQEVWKKQFGTIDNNKSFKEGSIHFGFLKQKDEQLTIDHFPTKTIYEVSKIDGTIIEKKESPLKIELTEQKNIFDFENFNLIIENNVIDQPLFKVLDKNNQIVWTYQTQERINLKEIYQNNNRLYFFNADNTILESIEISQKNPNTFQHRLKNLNFEVKENYSAHWPYKNSNPQIDSKVQEKNLSLKIKKLAQKINFFIENFKKITLFKISEEEKEHYLEFDITHEQNFYKNVFTEVNIEATFVNQSNQQKIKINGFYYDYNSWKIRAKLNKGLWKWEVKITTPFWTKKQSGKTEIKKDFQDNLTIKNGVFVQENNEVFIPIGLQDVILDQNKDGSPLNQIGYPKTQIPPTSSEEYNYLSLPDYLDLYVNEASINLFRYGPDNWAPSIWKSLENNHNFAMDINGNLQGDFILNESKKRNLRTMMSIFSFYPPYTSKESISKKKNQLVLSKYLDYVIARHASAVDIWELTNEALPSMEWQNFVSDYLAKHDPYKHPITTSLENTKLKNSDLLSIHLYTRPKNNFELVEKIEKLLQKPAAENWQGAIIISELGFSDANHFEGSADLMRKIAWVFVFRKNGIVFWNVGDRLFQNKETSNIYLGPEERSYLNNLQNFLPKLKHQLTNDFKINEEKNMAIYSLEDEYHKLYYLLNLNKTVKNDQKLELEISKKGILEFINPKNNILIETLELNEDAKEINLPYFEDDLAIKIIYFNN